MTTQLEPYRDRQDIAASLRDLTGQLAPSSRAIYERDAAHFTAWLDGRELTLPSLTRSEMIAYRDHLLGRYARATAARMLSVARRLLDEAVVRGHLAQNPAKGIRGIKSGDNETPHTALTLAEARALLAAVPRTGVKGLRDYALLSFLLRTGLRRSEAVALRMEDIRQEQGHTIAVVQHGKGDKRGVAKVPEDVVGHLRAYWDRADRAATSDETPVFCHVRRGGHDTGAALSTKAVELIVQTYGQSIGIKLTPHGLRATFITLALEGGAKLEQVQYAARHADPRTTERYQKRKTNLDSNAVDFVKL